MCTLVQTQDDSLQGKPSFEVRACAKKSFPGRPWHWLPTSLCPSPDQVFGCQLESLCQREGDTVPSFVRLCIAAVDKRGYFPRDPRVCPFKGPRPRIPHLPPPSFPFNFFLSSPSDPSPDLSTHIRAAVLILSLPCLLGLDVDGIYRVSGNLAVVQKLRFLVDRGEEACGQAVVLTSCLRTRWF